jgi:response regulator RpfG family c-di-GMP phosphodiesterase
VAKRIRENPKTKDVPIMFVTADRSPKPLEKFMAAGAVGSLYKPLDEEVLKRKVSLFLNIHKQKQRRKTQRVSTQ